MTIQEAYTYVLNILNPIYSKRESENIAKVLFLDAFQISNITRTDSFSYAPSILEDMVQRLQKREPIQYITGKSFFYEFEFKVTKDVLIPRPETEELVYTILQDHQNVDQLNILDIGTGSGCIPISIKKKKNKVEITATDVSASALSIAKYNADQHQTQITFLLHDILKRESWYALSNFDIIVSNPPYIDEKEKNKMPEHVLEWEPHLALFSSNNPLLFYDVISDFALEKLNKNGKLYFELNEFHSIATQKLVAQKGFKTVEILKDLEGKDRILKAVL